MTNERGHAHSATCWWHAAEARWVCVPEPTTPRRAVLTANPTDLVPAP
jgi:hypothetical protein